MKGFLSIDLAQHHLDAKLRVGFDGEEMDFLKLEHNRKSWRKLLKHAQKLGITDLRVCMEATNNYWKEIAEFFFKADATVYVVNPARIKAQRTTEQTRAKSDKIDKDVIMRFLTANHRDLHLWHPPTKSLSTLQSLVRYRNFLVEMRAALKVRTKSCKKEPRVVLSSLQMLKDFDSAIINTEGQIEEVIDKDEVLLQQFTDADTVPGVGPVNASVLIAECRAFVEIREVGQAVAFAGLDPKEDSSGKTSKPRKISKQGNALLRKTFVCAAASAIKTKGVFQDYYQRLRAKGLVKQSALVATARKLLEVTTAIVLAHKPFDPARNRLAA